MPSRMVYRVRCIPTNENADKVYLAIISVNILEAEKEAESQLRIMNYTSHDVSYSCKAVQYLNVHADWIDIPE